MTDFEVRHDFVSTTPDVPDIDLVRPSDWNEVHNFTGVLPVENGGTGQPTKDYTLSFLLMGG